MTAVFLIFLVLAQGGGKGGRVHLAQAIAPMSFIIFWGLGVAWPRVYAHQSGR